MFHHSTNGTKHKTYVLMLTFKRLNCIHIALMQNKFYEDKSCDAVKLWFCCFWYMSAPQTFVTSLTCPDLLLWRRKFYIRSTTTYASWHMFLQTLMQVIIQNNQTNYSREYQWQEVLVKYFRRHKCMFLIRQTNGLKIFRINTSSAGLRVMRHKYCVMAF